MPNLKLIPVIAIAAIMLASPLTAAQKNGAVAQDFKLTDMFGKTVQLSKFRGKTVVLEWHNPGCPFVQKHYGGGNMQAAQAAARKQGVVWLTVNSGAEGKQGHMTGPEAQVLAKKQGAAASHYLLDMNGVVGKAYGAKTTPHMYIIDGSGKLVYQGGIDDKPTANPADIRTARNHVTAALGEIKAGKTVSVAQSRPYGCSVKYAS
ncbi:redoxin domain-containing protein [Parasphingorhabdus halotolerans]|uniref:Redoxin domain-containing protein n=1 Tax=Parasphingorhabdus halotolerans TaxID=2725558 RepID=A0A6H2DN21_9SPHN|nr:redoxin domain-containing protein [Parasphingorhabdus halotolerans]QJB69151.1 redoxin domain-containing protein [Parasphingorhabdus halotolerans]